MLNLASFGPDDHQLLIQAGIEGLRDILALSLDDFRERIQRGATELEREPPRRPDGRGLVGAGKDARGGVGAVARLRCRATMPPCVRGRLADTGSRSRRRSRSSALTIPLFLNPLWVAFEQGRAEATAWTGFSDAELRARDQRDPR